MHRCIKNTSGAWNEPKTLHVAYERVWNKYRGVSGYCYVLKDLSDCMKSN